MKNWLPKPFFIFLLGFIILFIQYYSVICRPSDHTVLTLITEKLRLLRKAILLSILFCERFACTQSVNQFFYFVKLKAKLNCCWIRVYAHNIVVFWTLKYQLQYSSILVDYHLLTILAMADKLITRALQQATFEASVTS